MVCRILIVPAIMSPPAAVFNPVGSSLLAVAAYVVGRNLLG